MQNPSLDLSPLVAVLVRPHRMPIHADSSTHMLTHINWLGFDFHDFLRYLFEVANFHAKHEVMPLHRSSDPTLPDCGASLIGTLLNNLCKQ